MILQVNEVCSLAQECMCSVLVQLRESFMSNASMGLGYKYMGRMVVLYVR